MDISRKQFIESLFSGTALLFFSGCGGGGDYNGGANPAPAPPASSSCTPTIAANHGHVLAIAVADLDSASAKSYDIMGGAAHSHTVTFSPAQLQQMKAGTMVTVTSTPFAGDGHMHQVSVSCMIV